MKTTYSSDELSPILFDPKLMDPNQPTLWWCLDSLDTYVIGTNAVCKSMLVSWEELAKYQEVLADIVGCYEFILVCVPPGPDQDEVVEHLTALFYTPVLVPQEDAFHGCVSVGQLKDQRGEKAISSLLYGAKEIPMRGVLDLADVSLDQSLDLRRVLSGFPALDREIGGFSGGELSVWTGKRGSGKSTLLGKLLLEAVNQGHRVCAYSGEMPARQFKLSLLQQAAGADKVTQREDLRSGRIFYDVDPKAVELINEWWRGRLFLSDIKRENCHDELQILKIFEYAYRRYGCDVFLVDNIMTAQLKDAAALGYWQAQSAFTGRLVAFAKARGVHVHLVAHPRKTTSRLEADDIGGSADITNRADNVLKVERVAPEKLEKAGYSMLLTVLKNREFGALPRIKLDFDVASRRFYPAGASNNRTYSWEKAETSGMVAARLCAQGRAIKQANRNNFMQAQAKAKAEAEAAAAEDTQDTTGAGDVQSDDSRIPAQEQS